MTEPTPPTRFTPDPGGEATPGKPGSTHAFGVAGRTVVIAGATSAAGIAAARAFTLAGALVIAISSSRDRLDELSGQAPGVVTYACDLADAAAVAATAAAIRGEVGPVDGLMHLVGGWSGGGGLAGQTDEKWQWLHERLIVTLRNTTRIWFDDLVISDAGRLAIVSAVGVSNPTADNANYAALKAAAETWTLAVADGFRRAQTGTPHDSSPQRAAAAVLVINALVDDSMRAAHPGKPFHGFTDVADLGTRLASLWDVAAADLNGKRVRA